MSLRCREIFPGCLHVSRFIDLDWQMDALARIRVDLRSRRPPTMLQDWQVALWVKALIHLPDQSAHGYSSWHDVRDKPDQASVRWLEREDSYEPATLTEVDPSLLKKGRPLVYVGLGCTMNVCIGQTAKGMGPFVNIALASGDLLLFWGSSRMRHHTFLEIYPNTSPVDLKNPVGLLVTMKEVHP